MTNLLSEEANLRVGISASADLYNGNPTSDYFDLGEYERIAFVVNHGAGTTGTATFTVLAASTNSGTGAEAIPFSYRVHGVTAAVGAKTEATASGFTITAGANQIVIVEVRMDQLPEGKRFVALQATEVVDSPVSGAVMAAMTGPRYTDGSPPVAVS